MDLSFINPIGVLFATLSSFVIGFVWYGPLFGKAWMKESGIDPKKAGKQMAKTYGTTFVLALIQALTWTLVLGVTDDVGFSIFAAMVVSVGWVATAFGVNYLFEGKSRKLWAINVGYNIVTFVSMAVILSLL